VYSVKPNLGSLSGTIGPCNRNLSDTSTVPGLDVTITPLFNSATEKYMLKSFNFVGFTSACANARLGINILLAADASSNANATFSCIKNLPDPISVSSIVKFEGGITSECTKDSGWGGSDGSPLDIGTIVASDLARINLIVTG
jgi:hypothetical protein